MTRQTPGAERQEDGQHHGEFFGDQGDRRGQAGQEAIHPASPQHAISQDDERAEQDRGGAEPADDARRGPLQRRGLVVQPRQGLLDLAPRGAQGVGAFLLQLVVQDAGAGLEPETLRRARRAKGHGGKIGPPDPEVIGWNAYKATALWSLGLKLAGPW